MNLIFGYGLSAGIEVLSSKSKIQEIWIRRGLKIIFDAEKEN